MPKFFTWTDKTYKEQSEVPERIRAQLGTLWLKGAKPDELAATFKLPIAWVQNFVLEEHKPPRPN